MTQGYGRITPKWLIPLIVLGILALMFGSQSMNGFGSSSPAQSSGNDLDPNPAPNNIPANNNIPVATATATVTAKQTPAKTVNQIITVTPQKAAAKKEMRLAKRIGPSPVSKAIDEAQRVDYEIDIANDRAYGYVYINGDPKQVTASPIQTKSGIYRRDAIVVILVRFLDANGNCVLCQLDKLTNEYYSFNGGSDPNKQYYQQIGWVDKIKEATQWEVLIYTN